MHIIYATYSNNFDLGFVLAIFYLAYYNIFYGLCINYNLTIVRSSLIFKFDNL